VAGIAAVGRADATISPVKRILVRHIGDFEISECEIPEPGPGEVLLKVGVTGVCRTDLKIIRVGHRDLVLPRVPGEEVVGVVHAVGPGVSGVPLGGRYYVYPGIWCGKCPACLKGAENLCREMKIMGFHRDGGFADYVLAPVASLTPIPEGLPDDRAIFTEPLSCCLNALELGRVSEGKSVGIWGGGPAGTLLNRAAQALGAETCVIEPDARRRALIDGYEVPPRSDFDVCIVAVGSPAAYAQALSHLAPRGVLVVFSGLPPEEVSVSLNQLHYLEQTLVGAYGCSYRHGLQALDSIASGRVRVDDMVSHRLPLTELGRALEIVQAREGMKILLIP